MRTLVTVILAAAVTSLCACSSTDPGPGVPVPAPASTLPEPSAPDTTPPRANKEPASKTEGVVSRDLSSGLAERDALPIARAQATAPYPSQNVAICGETACAQGEFCCNESCGICAPVNGSCTQQVCGAPEQ